jgi:hypothetical protein
MNEQPAPPAVPLTGDPEVDQVLRDFDAAVRGEEDAQVEAAQQALTRLQARLSATS